MLLNVDSLYFKLTMFMLNDCVEFKYMFFVWCKFCWVNDQVVYD